MKRERGFVMPFAVPTWLIYLLIAAAIGAALWYAYDAVDGRGYARGKSETEAAYAKRDNKALQDALAKVAALQAEVRARESAYEAELEQIRNQHKKESADAQRQRDADIAAAVAGTLRLRDPGAAGRPACGDPAAGAEVPARTGRGDGAAAGELSAEASGFLLSLVHDADRNTRQLTAAQAVIVKLEKACSGP